MSFPADIVDAHHHLWLLDIEQSREEVIYKVGYPWLEAKGVQRFFGNPSPIQCNYLPTDLQRDCAQLPVTKSVHIQVGTAKDSDIRETQWLQQQVNSQKFPSAIVAFCDLAADDVQSRLEQHLVYHAVKGIRQIVGRSPAEDRLTGTHNLISNRQWLEGLRTISAYGLSFDLQLIPEQMASLYTILKQVDSLQVALCHCGSPWALNGNYASTDYWQLWRDGLAMLAQLPNVHCKISGLSMFQQSWDYSILKPIIETVIDTFGVQRCMFGSNFPIDKLHTDYRTIWNSYNQVTQGYSVAERNLLFANNAERFYKI